MATRFDPARSVARPVPPGPGGRIEYGRDLVAAGLLDEAEEILDSVATPKPDRRHEAHRLLLAGELALRREASARAVETLRQSARLAVGEALATIAVAAWRRLGDAHEARDEMPAAVDAWGMAHRQEERLAALQDTDDVRAGYLAAVPDEFDHQVRVAHEAVSAGYRPAAAAVATAIEAGRGAAILHRIRAQADPRARDLPAPGDMAGAWAWVARVRRGLHRSQAVWMVHPGPDAVHHVLIERWAVAAFRTETTRDLLERRIDAVCDRWARGARSLESGAHAFCSDLAELSAALGVDHVLSHLSRRVERIAVVAGAALCDVPFTALPHTGSDGVTDVLGCRFALSDLPCLSVAAPLRDQARSRRGSRSLLVQPSVGLPPAGGRGPLTSAAPRPGRTLLTREEATPEALRAALERGYPCVRIDSPGESGVRRRAAARPDGSDVSDRAGRAPDADPPVLFLWPVRDGDAPAEPPGPGDLRPADLASMALRHTGTLVVGACRSGMSTRDFRDERTGFVRSGLIGGASAVLAARWDVEDTVATRVLDTFEANLAVLPRDLALREALRTVRADGCTPPGPHGVVRWGAWTLYGDPGPQTRWGPVRRGLARWSARARATEETAGD